MVFASLDLRTQRGAMIEDHTRRFNSLVDIDTSSMSEKYFEIHHEATGHSFDFSPSLLLLASIVRIFRNSIVKHGETFPQWRKTFRFIVRP